MRLPGVERSLKGAGGQSLIRGLTLTSPSLRSIEDDRSLKFLLSGKITAAGSFSGSTIICIGDGRSQSRRWTADKLIYGRLYPIATP